MHTGRYREGIDEVDKVTWKTRLRCALNKAQDIVECKAESQVKAEDCDPYKVYELRPRQRKSSTPIVSIVVTTHLVFLLLSFRRVFCFFKIELLCPHAMHSAHS